MTKPKQRKGRPGPKIGPNLREVRPATLSLDPMTRRMAKVLGDGNESAGVREAVRVAYRIYQRTTTPSAEDAAAGATPGEAAPALPA